MTIAEAIIKAGNNKSLVNTKRKINHICYKVIDVTATKTSENDYDVYVALTPIIKDETIDLSLSIDEFLKYPLC
ncbi:hypothetical protein [Flavobacterium sp. UBA4197]|uniref:hypothetical protein n=1 Tax=Flavobacterium sp. UBA4197 TaxID=1946546 RepID=UPI00257BB12C|nr:hypothetical protein [Flavobacterium sp. UBA4197]